MPKTPRPECTIFWEPLSILLDDGLEDLVRQHHAEVGVHKKEMPLDCDWDEYQSLENLGMLRTLAVRRQDKLIAYNSFMVRKGHPHYRSTPHAMCDAIYVLPAHRRTGIVRELIEKPERDLALEFAGRHVRFWYHDKSGIRLLGPVLKKLGYEQIEECWDKMVRAE